jgi:peptide-methionine (S)-S-oxide reductase
MFEKATFAAGCFWGVEDTFLALSGVTATRVGYTGGRTEHPTYQEICSHNSGHAEAVEITFDPTTLPYQDLLKVFWDCHDPTQLNRQGPDVGDQYRSAIFFHSEEQRLLAQESLDRLEQSGRLRRRIVTRIVPAVVFWEAETYHQKYHQKHGGGCGF